MKTKNQHPALSSGYEFTTICSESTVYTCNIFISKPGYQKEVIQFQVDSCGKTKKHFVTKLIEEAK